MSTIVEADGRGRAQAGGSAGLRVDASLFAAVDYPPDEHGVSKMRWWGAFFHWFSQFTAFELALGLLPLTAFYLLASYLLLRRAVA